MVSITEREFHLISTFIKTNYGIILKEEKQSFVIGRLYSILEQLNFVTFTEYYNYLILDKTGVAIKTLIDRITTNHTFFMREAEHFTFLKNSVLPKLVKNIKDRDLRVWCACCSTGEEAYTIAMTIDEFFGNEKGIWDSKILATDISNRVLSVANTGEYSNERIEPLPAIWKSSYFTKNTNGQYKVCNYIKNEVIFRELNLINDGFPFKRKLHIIFCRNVMIYFDAKTRDEIIGKFYDCLENGGYLFIGHTESINRNQSKFKYIMPAVYRKEE